MGVAELERLATALYVYKEPKIESNKRAERIHELKPHIPIEEATSALSFLEQIINDAQSLVPSA